MLCLRTILTVFSTLLLTCLTITIAIILEIMIDLIIGPGHGSFGHKR